MTFILTGVRQDAGYRIFEFEGIASDKQRYPFAVRADLDLIRRFGIQIQELPLLCRRLLDQMGEGNATRAITFTADQMQEHADQRAAAVEELRSKRQRRAVPVNRSPGGWRTPQS